MELDGLARSRASSRLRSELERKSALADQFLELEARIEKAKGVADLIP